MDHLSYRNIWVSAGIATAILAIGGILLRDVSEAAMGAVALLALVGGIVILHILDDRELRQGKSD